MGAKLEHIITRLAQEAVEKIEDHEAQKVTGGKTPDISGKVKPSDEHFWFHRPGIVLTLIHFILFQNSFEIAFFFWILVKSLALFLSVLMLTYCWSALLREFSHLCSARMDSILALWKK